MKLPFILGACLLGLAAVGAPASILAGNDQAQAEFGRLVTVSTDPFVDPASYHSTEVEPDIAAHAGELVATFQVGRVFDGGAADLGWATSIDDGHHWVHGFLPDTVYSGGPYARISDPVVAYDSKHHTWLISGLDVNSLAIGSGVSVNRSPDGFHWSAPIQVFSVPPGGFVDKDWITCDDTPTSPFYGTCYAEFDLPSQGDLLQMSSSSDGGLTWSAPQATADQAHGLGGQPLVQPDGTLIVPYWGFSRTSEYIGSFMSTNGGRSYSAHVVVSPIQMFPDGGAIRTSPLPSAQEDADGTIYVTWNDCRFRPGCSANDIVFSTSTNGTVWSAPTRVPTDAVSSSEDTFTPGIGIDSGTGGASARIGLYYYYYPNANCDIETCQLDIGYVSSTNGGRTWSQPQQVAGPIDVTDLAPTTGGLMFGDYIATSVVQGRSITVLVRATAPRGDLFQEPTVAPAGGLPVTGGSVPAQTAIAAPALAGQAPRVSVPTAF